MGEIHFWYIRIRPTTIALTVTPEPSPSLLKSDVAALYQCLQLGIREGLALQGALRVKVEKVFLEPCVEFGVQLYGAPPNLPHSC